MKPQPSRVARPQSEPWSERKQALGEPVVQKTLEPRAFLDTVYCLQFRSPVWAQAALYGITGHQAASCSAAMVEHIDASRRFTLAGSDRHFCRRPSVHSDGFPEPVLS